MVTKVFVTAATSQLGSLVVEDLLKGPERQEMEISIGVRDHAKVPQHWIQAGVKAIKSDYTESSDQWAKTLEGQDRVLLISSNTQINSGRDKQHQNVIEGAKKAGVKVLAYTGILNQDNHELALAKDHAKTEAFLKSSGIPYVFLRNGWYTENTFTSAPSWPHVKTLFSAAGKAKFSFAARKDYAAAAAVILRPSFTKTNVVFELAGDQSFTLDQFAEEVSKHTPYTLQHQSLSADQYSQALAKHGVPQDIADVLAESDRKAELENALETNSKDLSNLIGRPTEPVTVTIAEFFK